jgi:hypothetical protein
MNVLFVLCLTEGMKSFIVQECVRQAVMFVNNFTQKRNKGMKKWGK